MKKNTDKNKEKTYRAGEVLTMLESINDSISVIAEQHLGISNRLDGMDKKFNKVDERFDKIDEKFNKVDERFDKIDERFEGIDERLDNMQADMNTVKSDVFDIKYDLRQKVSYDDFAKMEKRVLKLEKIVSAKFC